MATPRSDSGSVDEESPNNMPGHLSPPVWNEDEESEEDYVSPVLVLYDNANLGIWDDDDNDEQDPEDATEESDEPWMEETPDGLSSYYPQVEQPVPAGVELERSGHYEKPPDHYLASQRRLKSYSKNLVDLMAGAEGSYRPFDKRELGETNIPNNDGTEVAAYGSRIYSGQYSDDGSFFYTCAQSFRVYIYDMTVAPRPSGQNDCDISCRSYTYSHAPTTGSSQNSSLNMVRTFQAPVHNCRWTITDANLSPDNNWMAYSSISNIVHLVKTRGEDAVLGLGLEDHEQEALDFGDDSFSRRSFGIWSLSFGADGKELIAGGSGGRIFAYDVERKTSVLNVVGHTDDTNAVCFADKSDPNILVSGSDDTLIKIWDRRSLQNAKPAGVLIGHTEGLTYVSAKGDGRYIVSNGKDQAAKLWDLRKTMSGEAFEQMERLNVSIRGWDYRNGVYEKPRVRQHPQDCSVMTYRGHSVLNTLIRVHFSPPHITGHRYIASGSSDGRIHVWNLDGTIAQVINRSKTVPLVKASRPSRSGLETRYLYNDPYDSPERSKRTTPQPRLYGYDSMTVRDVSWNPNEPVLISTSWGGSCSVGSLALHPFMPHAKRLRVDPTIS